MESLNLGLQLANIKATPSLMNKAFLNIIEVTRKQPGLYIGLGLAYLLVFGSVNFARIQLNGPDSPSYELLFLEACLGGVFGIILFYTIPRTYLEIIGKPREDSILQHFKNSFLDLVIEFFKALTLFLIGFILLIIPGLIIAMKTLFYYLYCLFDQESSRGQEPGWGVKSSLRLTHGAELGLFLSYIPLGLFPFLFSPEQAHDPSLQLLLTILQVLIEYLFALWSGLLAIQWFRYLRHKKGDPVWT